jgi:hypothetical protein
VSTYIFELLLKILFHHGDTEVKEQFIVLIHHGGTEIKECFLFIQSGDSD